MCGFPLGKETAKVLLMQWSGKPLSNMRKILPSVLSLMRVIIKLKNTVRLYIILVSRKKKSSAFSPILFAGMDIRLLLLGT